MPCEPYGGRKYRPLDDQDLDLIRDRPVCDVVRVGTQREVSSVYLAKRPAAILTDL
ncbi:hypothetical protein CH063_04926 [Colletotrichum higginsianum]|uniref:Uncharacterized protein n=1 Tax=Colletotrichum higginsianum (strain IMI 349063) TaxID=759273 RepID=H1UX65_COLHI|nr:hypothetical protein CH063_04926 [Colletotrichum higginsianum]